MKRVFSGIQPSGEIHLGNYLGAIANWIQLVAKYDCIFSIVDYHAMTVPYDPRELQRRIFDAALVNIACGLDPEKCTLFVQSRVPEHTELAWILGCHTPLGELERMTQFKMKAEQHRESIHLGLLSYPVLQAADIILYKAQLVPVGEDQVQHLEIAREIARRFNRDFGDVFPEPQPLLTATPRVMGVDGAAKMSKSMNNTIGVLEEPAAIWEKLRVAKTDPARQRRSDPGEPTRCNIFTIHRGFSPASDLAEIETGCRSAGIGCIDCKKILAKNMEPVLAPARERAAALRAHPDRVHAALEKGASRCQGMAHEVMDEVRAAVGLRASDPRMVAKGIAVTDEPSPEAA